MPNFLTTTEDDVKRANNLVMGFMQQYFEYQESTCGLPSGIVLREERDISNI
jgi:hypothetical protein